MAHDAKQLAEYFVHIGLKKGDFILYQLSGSPSFYLLFLAASMMGAVVVGAGIGATPHELEQIADDTDCSMIVADANVLATTRKAIGKNIPSFLVNDSIHPDVPSLSELKYHSSDTSAELARRADEASEDDPLFIVYTSGTTGRPKGAVITQGNALASALVQDEHFGGAGGATPEDVWQLQVPVNHISGTVEWGVAPLVAGSTVIINRAFDAHTILENTARHHATMLCGVPAMWNLMFALPDFDAFDLSSVRWCMNGAAPLPDALWERIMHIAPACSNPLGLTETSGFCTYSSEGADLDELVNTVGTIARNLECKLIGEHGNPTILGEVGQIAYKGPSVISHYHNHPEATSTAFDEDGFFLSGDLAYADELGRLHLCGRNDETFITAGRNVYPAEIENELLLHPGIAHAAVVPIPHRMGGSVGRAYVVPKPGAELTGVMLRSYLANHLSTYKIPRSYVIAESIPLTSLGKPRKKELLAQIATEFGNDYRL